MLFQVKGSEGRSTVLVITEIHPTLARAVPHPKSNGGALHIQDRAKKTPSDPLPLYSLVVMSNPDLKLRSLS